MDLSIYFNMIFSTAWYVIPIFIFTVIIKSAWFIGFFKGMVGELKMPSIKHVYLIYPIETFILLNGYSRI